MRNVNIMYRIFPAPTSVLRIQAVQPNLNDRQRLFIWLDQDDIYSVVSAIRKQTGILVIRERDYVKNPKENGYKSYHIVA